ncbi:MAG: hypothetical protein KKD64_06685 [Alphaproteobacteria bacterium]|nr:hypothetical protein [Alphaproteobacteria bacterium]MBU0792865.1 hypothetical protein [Alphaproteobacteria bacterium]MBU0876620.1 hypothetical protein [Alphaproteobacteria bacterium]MBU1769322.1 hypothetical protein [Alphaproteobacteria bacterium]
MTERDNNGRFPKGTSGNRKGRPRTSHRRIETPEDFDEMIIDVMNMPTAVRTPKGEETVPLATATMLRLATGKAENRLAASYALSLTRSALFQSMERARQRRSNGEDL